MGIFLLNSVNELVSTGKLGAQGEARSLPTDMALSNLVKDSHRHEEVFALFNSTAFDFFDHEDGQNLLEKLKPTNPATAVNSYVRLLMNLVNAYIRDGSEFECIYAAYCYEVNQQARVGGMASSVAKINSVGLRLALRELRTDNTVAALARSPPYPSPHPHTRSPGRCSLGTTSPAGSCSQPATSGPGPGSSTARELTLVCPSFVKIFQAPAARG
jgi:hypothetical protein